MTQVLDAPVATTEATSFPPLNAFDRCEGVTYVLDNGRHFNGCGAQGFVRAVLPSEQDLIFCKHHANEYEPALGVLGVRYFDESGMINTKPTDPSRSNV
jgi:hypothetical protein